MDDPSRFPYIDDLLQLYAVTRPSAAEAARAAAGVGPLQPPLDYALGFLAARLSPDLAVLRLLPALWGALAAAAAWRLGARLRGPALGLWWGALTAASLPLVSYSVTFRSYSLAVLLALLAWNAFEDLLDGRDARPYALAQALLQLAWPHAWLLGLAQLARAALRHPARRAAAAKALVPSWLALAAWLGAWHLAVPSRGGFHYEVPLAALGAIARTFCQGLGPGLILLPSLAAAGAVLARRERASLAAAVQLAPLALIFLVHRAESVLLLPRHVLPLLPAWLGLAALGADALSRGRRAAAAAVAACLLWAAAVPLRVLAAREAALSGAIAGATAELDRLAGPRDVLVFADPNTGATVLHGLDRRAFDALAGVSMREGFAFFEFPPALRAAGRDAYALCFLDPGLATIDRARYRALRAAGRTVWLVALDGLNAAPRPEPFDALGLALARLDERAPGIYTERR
ncbi:MAG: hypothetical protein M0D55_05885 [Elusimicrobiota bacterium]|nr:MAG: hypothetical protein M0D55_05885 [Elusimicrobiota bacterium]